MYASADFLGESSMAHVCVCRVCVCVLDVIVCLTQCVCLCVFGCKSIGLCNLIVAVIKSIRINSCYFACFPRQYDLQFIVQT